MLVKGGGKKKRNRKYSLAHDIFKLLFLSSVSSGKFLQFERNLVEFGFVSKLGNVRKDENTIGSETSQES